MDVSWLMLEEGAIAHIEVDVDRETFSCNVVDDEWVGSE